MTEEQLKQLRDDATGAEFLLNQMLEVHEETKPVDTVAVAVDHVKTLHLAAVSIANIYNSAGEYSFMVEQARQVRTVTDTLLRVYVGENDILFPAVWFERDGDAEYDADTISIAAWHNAFSTVLRRLDDKRVNQAFSLSATWQPGNRYSVTFEVESTEGSHSIANLLYCKDEEAKLDGLRATAVGFFDQNEHHDNMLYLLKHALLSDNDYSEGDPRDKIINRVYTITSLDREAMQKEVEDVKKN